MAVNAPANLAVNIARGAGMVRDDKQPPLGEALRAWRVANGLTREECAAFVLEVPVHTLEKWERGETPQAEWPLRRLMQLPMTGEITEEWVAEYLRLVAQIKRLGAL
jgi:transcriptional regulator with XRE-family HTH domain